MDSRFKQVRLDGQESFVAGELLTLLVISDNLTEMLINGDYTHAQKLAIAMTLQMLLRAKLNALIRSEESSGESPF